MGINTAYWPYRNWLRSLLQTVDFASVKPRQELTGFLVIVKLLLLIKKTKNQNKKTHPQKKQPTNKTPPTKNQQINMPKIGNALSHIFFGKHTEMLHLNLNSKNYLAINFWNMPLT